MISDTLDHNEVVQSPVAVSVIAEEKKKRKTILRRRNSYSTVMSGDPAIGPVNRSQRSAMTYNDLVA